MKLRERQDALGEQLAVLTDVLMETRTPQNKFALPYDLRLKLDDVRKNLRGLGYEIIKPKPLRLDALIKLAAKASVQTGELSISTIIDSVLAALSTNEPAYTQVKAATGASDVLDARVWEYLETEINAYFYGPPLEIRE